jgi:hypothetical protein
VTERTFGARIRDATVEEVLALESAHLPASAFVSLDRIISRVVRSSLAGNRVAVLRDLVKPYETIDLLGRDDADVEFIARHFDLATQQGRGAWFLPDEARVGIGWANWPHHSTHYGRYANGVAQREIAKVRFDKSPSALFAWLVLEPLFDLLYKPIVLRGPKPIEGDKASRRQAWDEVSQFYDYLEIDSDVALRRIGFGNGWSKLRAPQQLAARQELTAALAELAPSNVGGRYRVWSLRELVAKYYAKASRSAPTMRGLLTKPLQRAFCAFFGGDWFSFLSYLGEQPSRDEQISSVLPEPRLYVGASARVRDVAKQQGVSAEEIERMVAALWSSGIAESPVQSRVRVMLEFWDHFDTAHSMQAPGMDSLWGLADSEAIRLDGLDDSSSGPEWYHPGQYRSRLPVPLLNDITALWNGLMLPWAPTVIVTSPSPFNGMLDAFGPALRFWHGVGLTAWFVSEGPMSRTDMAGLEQQHERDLEALAEMNTGVDKTIFAELIAAERLLGKPSPYTTGDSAPLTNVSGIQISTSLIAGSRRGGFERLRDIITRHRRAWRAAHLDNYLRARWESEIRNSAREYARFVEVKAKTPSAKQFAKFAEKPANNWFGGDANLLYAAFGEKAPSATRRVRLIPGDARKFALSVFYALGGKTQGKTQYPTNERDQARYKVEWDNHWKRKRLAEASVKYAQLREALGRQPTVGEFGRHEFEYQGSVLHADPELAWAAYATVIDQLLLL